MFTTTFARLGACFVCKIGRILNVAFVTLERNCLFRSRRAENGHSAAERRGRFSFSIVNYIVLLWLWIRFDTLEYTYAGKTVHFGGKPSSLCGGIAFSGPQEYTDAGKIASDVRHPS